MSLAKTGCLGILIWLFSSCASTLYRPLEPAPARLGEYTGFSEELRSLPAPGAPIVVAVYQFRDQTGQYKDGGGFSTAVTQGATNILVRAMKDSGWFTPIERENLNNLLNERKIIRSTWNQYGVQQNLQALLYANLIFEGGIVSFDSNVITGGTGLRYFGAGGSEQYRQDRVTVYLRAVNVNTGEIVKTVYTSKTVLSQAVDVGIFRFVSFKRLLEFETGITYNEPAEMAVTEAVEKAVHSMIVEGVLDNLWALDNKGDLNQPVFQNYQKEKAAAARTDELGKTLQDRRTKFGVSVGTSHVLYQGDYPNPLFRTGAEVGVRLHSSPRSAWNFALGTGEIRTANDFYRSYFAYADLDYEFRPLPLDRFTPILFAGGGMAARTGQKRLGFNRNAYFPKVQLGAGLEFLPNKRLGIFGSVSHHFPFTDQLDEITQGRYNDFYWRGRVGFTWYL